VSARAPIAALLQQRREQDIIMDYALIWGATGGIGRAVLAGVRAAGLHPLAIARDPLPLEAEGYDACAADVTRPHDVAAAALWAAQQSGGAVALWVYAVGAMSNGPLADTSTEALSAAIDVNLIGAHRAVHHSLPLIPAGGHLIFLGAYPDRIALPKLGAYAAGKAALDSYITVLTKELRDRTVTNLRLSAVDTPLWQQAPFRLPRGARQPHEVADAVLRAYRERTRGVVEA
jgi:NAD(P)-dependent dehydrogenase (short-subunit alcohol dehydrogenase family)